VRRTNTILTGVITALGVIIWAFGMTPSAQAHPDRGCNSCHVPHGAYSEEGGVPLWSPAHTTTTLNTFYANPDTMDATTGQVSGASKLCLSCHDGTYPAISRTGSKAFGVVADASHQMGRLEDSHPISFVYDAALAAADGELKDPSTLDRDVLDGLGRMQCTSCHDVHNGPTRDAGSEDDKNLRWAYFGSEETAAGQPYEGQSAAYITANFCRNCHVK
jgi:hypothetical protein